MYPKVYASHSEITDGAPPRALRVLVVDDEPDTVMTLLEVLREAGYHAEGFASGVGASQGFRDFDPDVIISDIAMPIVNGWDLARQVRVAMGNKRPLMIAISGQYTKRADKLLAELHGFNHYLTKPCDPDALLAILEKAKHRG